VQHVPPLPAPQETCIVNRFQPKWGTPPGWYNGIALDFDPKLGAYTFDSTRSDYAERLAAYREQSIAHSLGAGPPPDPSLRSMSYWFSVLAGQYQSGYMLQPYKTSGDKRWRTRWIPQRRRVSCHTE
jgi:hypothetical protein